LTTPSVSASTISTFQRVLMMAIRLWRNAPFSGFGGAA
jgi:hypothetical protein